MSDIYKAERANQLLQNETFKEVMEELKRDTLECWQRSGVGEKDLRESLYNFATALDSIKNRLQAMADDGKIILTKANKPVIEDDNV